MKSYQEAWNMAQERLKTLTLEAYESFVEEMMRRDKYLSLENDMEEVEIEDNLPRL